jgi:hypothetical protein
MRTNSKIGLKLSAVALAAGLAAGAYFVGGSNLFFRATANSAGPPPAHTGAPLENSCIECHNSFPINSGGGAVFFSGLTANYTPGKSVPVTVTVNQNNAVVFGFETTVLDNAGATAGTYAVPGGNNPQMQIVNGVVGTPPNQVTRRYVEHTIDGITPVNFNTKSWTFTWTSPATRKGKLTFYAAGNGANSDGTTSGDYIYTNSQTVCSGTVQANFDGDNRADISVFRPSNGAWYRLNSSNNQFVSVLFGQAGDKPVPGDFDGDGKNDVAVFRPSNGVWYILNSSNNSFAAYQFGTNGDLPVIGDYSGDGRSELAVYRPSNGVFYTLNLANNAFSAVQWGTNGDKPISGDFDGDGKTDFAVFRPSNGVWYILNSSNNSFAAYQFGNSSDKPVPGDYDGDGKTDFAVFRPSNGVWYFQNSTQGFSAIQFGANNDAPVPNDYDGDCKTDIAVFRAGIFYVLNSGNNSPTSVNFGLSNDIPISSAYVPE